MNFVGVIGCSIFGYRLDISLKSILSLSGKTEEDISPITLELLRSITNCWNEDPKLTLSGRILLRVISRILIYTISLDPF